MLQAAKDLVALQEDIPGPAVDQMCTGFHKKLKELWDRWQTMAVRDHQEMSKLLQEACIAFPGNVPISAYQEVLAEQMALESGAGKVTMLLEAGNHLLEGFKDGMPAQELLDDVKKHALAALGLKMDDSDMKTLEAVAVGLKEAFYQHDDVSHSTEILEVLTSIEKWLPDAMKKDLKVMTFTFNVHKAKTAFLGKAQGVPECLAEDPDQSRMRLMMVELAALKDYLGGGKTDEKWVCQVMQVTEELISEACGVCCKSSSKSLQDSLAALAACKGGMENQSWLDNLSEEASWREFAEHYSKTLQACDVEALEGQVGCGGQGLSGNLKHLEEM